MSDRIRGMKDAVQMAEMCNLYDTGDLSAKHAAQAMKDIITGCIRAHINAAEHTELDAALSDDKEPKP